MTQPVILSDADNTLWDTNSVFATAQVKLLHVIENAVGKHHLGDNRLGFVRLYDQAIAMAHHAHFRYPAALLARSLSLGLSGIDAQSAANIVLRGSDTSKTIDQVTIEHAVDIYSQELARVPELLPTVRDSLRYLKEADVSIYVLTEGRLKRQLEILAHHDLTQFFAGEFEVAKSTELFRRLRLRFSPNETIVIGDQPDRDILPAKLAGCTTILVPSDFQPTWHSNDQYVDADLVATSFNVACEWALQR